MLQLIDEFYYQIYAANYQIIQLLTNARKSYDSIWS